MSSNAFSADLRPEPALQRLALLSGVLLGIAGIAMILALPLAPAWRAAGCAACVAACAAELGRLRNSWRCFVAVRIAHDGSAALLDRDGAWHPARLQAGSVLLRRHGWLIFTSDGGRGFAAAFRGHGREDVDWRRLQVIWRHIGAER